MAYLTDPEAQVAKARTYRYFVELASEELDCEGVPESFQIVDVVVLEPTQEAIKTVIAAADWLKGYTIVSYWNPNDCAEF